ncbi:MAG TPA: PBP1A family penicillin-binding protein [Pyrinomonadaceae bacterium]|nr:PBP1A family penicillin-binding protein [Pyrinomonadaceae bacterium]
MLLFTAAFGADELLRSYKYYSRLIDSRLASGYLTSRPGIYAAPRTIRPGQGFTQAALVKILQRSGYIETQASEVWSGSFKQIHSAIEIRPRRYHKTSEPQIVRVSFSADRIGELTGDEIPLESFALEPEVLSNDLSSKTGNRSTLAYLDIPPVLVHAILAIEDRRFFQHSGLDPFGLARALVRNAGDERIGQGGSTISQQLVKNTYLSPERTFRRKYAEAMLAFALERRLAKEDIFALYCNEVYLGQRGAVVARGVEQAAQIYFGKELKDLSLNEAATIAGMIQSPARFSPERNQEATRARRDLVLAAMVRGGWISDEVANAAGREPVAVVPLPQDVHSVAPHFIDYVNRVNSDPDGGADRQRVYTTIDLDLQQLAETALQQQLDQLDKKYPRNTAKPEAALVALDPHTGNVLAMVGGRNYGESQLNRATDARRQPGSTFKPFVYAAALEDGFSPMQLYEDAPREFTYDRNRTYRPANFGGAYSMREVTMRTGLVKSLNVVTVDVAVRTGLARIANLAAQFGLPRPERYPALALGTTEATPLQLAAAYATFANGGRRVEPKVVTSVSESPIATVTAAGEGQVISSTTAYMITNMLAAVVDHGTGRAARDAMKGTAVAGKTGTSRDGWFIGYTPNLVCAVWIGFDDNSQLGMTGAAAALPLWTEFMQSAVALRPELGGRAFECPEGIKFVETDVDNGLLSTLSCPHRELVAITERLAPNFECYNHGNLPQSMPESFEVSEAAETISVAQHAKPKPLSHQRDYLSSKSTRVDIDSRGHRTLVNEMR